jgi:hypothetical protein
MTGLALLLSLAYLGLAFWAPGALSNLFGLVALGAAAFLRLSPQARTLSLALLTLAFTLGLWRSGNTLGLIGLVGILVALTTLPRIPNWIRALLGLAILLVSVPLAGFANTFIFELGIQIGIYAAMALGLNVVVGMAGLLDLGYAAFFAVGAYTWAIFGSRAGQELHEGELPPPRGVHVPLHADRHRHHRHHRPPHRPARRAPSGGLPGHRHPGPGGGGADPGQQPGPPHQLHQRPPGDHPGRAPPHRLVPRPHQRPGHPPGPDHGLPALLLPSWSFS